MAHFVQWYIGDAAPNLFHLSWMPQRAATVRSLCRKGVKSVICNIQNICVYIYTHLYI